MHQAKKHLREKLLETRRSMSFEDVYRLSARIQKRFLMSPYYRESRVLSLYSSSRNEPLTDEVFQRAVSEGKDVYYPGVVKGSRHLDFFRVRDLSELSPGSYDIPEPGVKEAGCIEDFDLVVVPGIVFDLSGARLGFGKGYYDRVLKGFKKNVVALAYEFQVLSDNVIPVEPHDVRVIAIVTEKRTIRTVPPQKTHI